MNLRAFLLNHPQIARGVADGGRRGIPGFAQAQRSASVTLGRGPGPLSPFRPRASQPPPGRSGLSPARPPHPRGEVRKVAILPTVGGMLPLGKVAWKRRWCLTCDWCSLYVEQSTKDEENLTCPHSTATVSPLPSGLRPPACCRPAATARARHPQARPLSRWTMVGLTNPQPKCPRTSPLAAPIRRAADPVDRRVFACVAPDIATANPVLWNDLSCGALAPHDRACLTWDKILNTTWDKEALPCASSLSRPLWPQRLGSRGARAPIWNAASSGPVLARPQRRPLGAALLLGRRSAARRASSVTISHRICAGNPGFGARLTGAAPHITYLSFQRRPDACVRTAFACADARHSGAKKKGQTCSTRS